MKNFSDDDFKYFVNKIIPKTPVRCVNYVPYESIDITQYKDSIVCMFYTNEPEFVYRCGGCAQIGITFFSNGECYYRDPRYNSSTKGLPLTEYWFEYLESKNVTINDIFENELKIEK